MLRAACLAVGLLAPGLAAACDGQWRVVQSAFAAAGMQLSEARGSFDTLGQDACAAIEPTIGMRGGTEKTARSAVWRTNARTPEGHSLLIDIQVRGLSLRAGPGDEMAGYLADEFDLARPTDLALTLIWAAPTGRLELRSRGGSLRPSIWAATTLSDVGAPTRDTWWDGLEAATFSTVSARLRGDGTLERAVLALLALDRLRGDGTPAPRLDALKNVVRADIDRLPSETVDALSRSALAQALNDIPGRRGALSAILRWQAPQSVAGVVAGLMSGRWADAPRIDIDYDR